jgi:hypothetical protein
VVGVDATRTILCRIDIRSTRPMQQVVFPFFASVTDERVTKVILKIHRL